MLTIPEYKDCEAIFRFFEEISRIPHGSGNTGAIAEYLVNFAKERGLEYIHDEHDNVVIRKSATEGYETRPAVVIQGHLDMVAEKTQDSDKNMQTDGLDIYRDGDFIRARGTTLGADDGVSIAYALAILDSDDVPHPDVEALFTSDEEIGLLGATAISEDAIKGRILINVDSDAEGILTVGCAGGMRSDITLPIRRRPGWMCNLITVDLHGFKGGHSGVEIDKGRVNAVKALAEALALINPSIVSLSGGNADNAIPRSVSVTLTGTDEDAVRSALDSVLMKYREIEPDTEYTLTAEMKPALPLTDEASEKVISLLNTLPSGVIAMSSDIEGLVETSLNLGILRLSEKALDVSFSVRSAKGDEKMKLGERLRAIAKDFGAEYGERGGYPAWEYKRDSHLREVCERVYARDYGREPLVIIIHAGLECGILSEKFPGLDCVSIGPDAYDIHTTEERLSIPSFVRVYGYIKTILKEI